MSASNDVTGEMIAELSKSVDVKVEKPQVPSWARRVPKRTIYLAGVSVAAVIVYFVCSSVVAGATSPQGNGGLFAPWRLNIASVVFLWVGVVAGASSLWTWLLHVRDREFIIREIAFRTQASKRG